MKRFFMLVKLTNYVGLERSAATQKLLTNVPKVVYVRG